MLANIDRVAEIHVNRTESHLDNLGCFNDSSEGFFDLISTSQFKREGLSFKSSHVIDRNWQDSKLTDLSVEVSAGQERQEAVLRLDDLVSSRSSSLNEELKQLSIFSLHLHIFSEDRLVEIVSFKGSPHEKGS